MWNIKIIIYAAIMLLFSLYVIAVKPDMHKQAVITDSEYGFVQAEVPPAQLKASNKDMTFVPQKIENKPVQTNQYTKPQQKINTSQLKTPKEVNKPNNSVKKNNNENNKPQPLQTKQEVKQEPKKEIKQEQPTAVQPQKVVKPILTEQEEIIAWNKWRSNLQNQVMRDSKVSAPLGTQFKFSFTVDKFGNMSNIKVWSTSPAYTDYAVRMIKPVLMNYRNKPILNFPEGTKRVITNVNGGFVISRVTEYSTPADYHDYEHVKR